jgi:hypothetical protein
MKIVGGPRDGQFVNVQAGQRDIVMPDPTELRAVGDYNGDMTPELVTTTQTAYTVRRIHGPDGSLEFLAPADWGDWRAIKHQFAK